MRAPNRAVGTRYGARVMFSMPPATTTSTSPARIICDAIATDFSPDPHSMLIVVAGTSFGMPAASATWRAGFWPSPACNTQPSTTSSTSSADTPARASAARTACVPSSVAATSLNWPPKLPTGVLTALTITACSIDASLATTTRRVTHTARVPSYARAGRDELMAESGARESTPTPEEQVRSLYEGAEKQTAGRDGAAGRQARASASCSLG